MKSDKMPYIIQADIESLIRKMDGCVNNPENPSTEKQVSIFFVAIQCQHIVDLITQMIKILYIVEKIV